MMKFLKKNSIISLVLGLVLVVYAVLTKVIKDVAFFNPSVTVGRVIIGLFLIAFAVLVSFKGALGKNNKTVKTLKIVEGTILILGSLIGFILPIFDINLLNISSNGSLWLGLALVMNGSFDLYLNFDNKLKLNNGSFFIKLFSILLGSFIYGANLVDSKMELVVFLVILLFGLFLTIFGLVNLKRKKD